MSALRDAYNTWWIVRQHPLTGLHSFAINQAIATYTEAIERQHRINSKHYSQYHRRRRDLLEAKRRFEA